MSGWGDLMQRLGQDGSKWQCTTCLTFTANDLSVCPCCEALRPGTEVSAAPAVVISSTAPSAASLFGGGGGGGGGAAAPTASTLFAPAPVASIPTSFTFGAPVAATKTTTAAAPMPLFNFASAAVPTPTALQATPFAWGGATATTAASVPVPTPAALASFSFAFGTPAPIAPTIPPPPPTPVFALGLSQSVLSRPPPVISSSASLQETSMPTSAPFSSALAYSTARFAPPTPAPGSVRAAIVAMLPGPPATCTACFTVFTDSSLFCPACHVPHTRRIDTPASAAVAPPTATAAAAAFMLASNAASRLFAASTTTTTMPVISSTIAPPTPASSVITATPAAAPIPSITPQFTFNWNPSSSSSVPVAAPPPAPIAATAVVVAPAPTPVPAPAPTPVPAPAPAAGDGSMARDIFPPISSYKSPSTSTGILIPIISQTNGVADYETFALPLGLSGGGGGGGGGGATVSTVVARGAKRVKAELTAPRWSVFSCGSGECEQLGLGGDPVHEDDQYSVDTPALVRALARVPIMRLAVGGLHTLLLAADGAVWSFGCNDDCALGRGGAENRPGRVRGPLEGVSVIALAAGDSHSVALDAAGRVYAWGTYKGADGYLGFDSAGKSQKAAAPVRLDALTARFGPVVAISSGADHTGALTAAGRGIVWGYGGQGQLGRHVAQKGDDGASAADVLAQLEPTALPLPRGAGPFAPRIASPSLPAAAMLADVKVEKLSRESVAAAAAAVVVDDDVPMPPTRKGSRGGGRGGGKGAGAGAGAAVVVAPPPPVAAAAKGGAKRKRGAATADVVVSAPLLKEASSVPSTATIESLSLDEQPIGRLWCVGYCTFLQTAPDGTGAGGGLVYACGLNSYGQLGLGDTTDRTIPTLVRALSAPCAPGGGLVSIVGGSQHALALTRDGGVLAWGRGDSGQLGLAANADTRGRLPVACGAFTPRQISPASFGGMAVVSIAANGCSSAAITVDGALSTWGFGESGQLAHGQCADENTPRNIKSSIFATVGAGGLGGQHIITLAMPSKPMTTKELADDNCAIVEDPLVPIENDDDDEDIDIGGGGGGGD